MQDFRRRLNALRAHLAIDVGDHDEGTRDLELVRGISDAAEVLVHELASVASPSAGLMDDATALLAQARSALKAAEHAQQGQPARGRHARLAIVARRAPLRWARAHQALGIWPRGPWGQMLGQIASDLAQEPAPRPRLEGRPPVAPRRLRLLLQALVIRRAPLVPRPDVSDAIGQQAAVLLAHAPVTGEDREVLVRVEREALAASIRIREARETATADTVVSAYWAALRQLRLAWVDRATRIAPGDPAWWAMVERALELEATAAIFASRTDLSGAWHVLARTQDLTERMLKESVARSPRSDPQGSAKPV